MFGYDLSITAGRKFGGLVSVGRSQLIPTWTVGVKASQMLTNWSDVAQLNLTETVEYGQIDEFTYVRGSIYLSFHRIVGLNLGAQLESDEYGAPPDQQEGESDADYARRLRRHFAEGLRRS